MVKSPWVEVTASLPVLYNIKQPGLNLLLLLLMLYNMKQPGLNFFTQHFWKLSYLFHMCSLLRHCWHNPDQEELPGRKCFDFKNRDGQCSQLPVGHQRLPEYQVLSRDHQPDFQNLRKMPEKEDYLSGFHLDPTATCILGRWTPEGSWKKSFSSWLHWRLPMSINIVREAFVTSVTCLDDG